MAVNLSMRQLRHPGIVSNLAGALSHSGLPPFNLVLEVTESLVMKDADDASARLQRLKALGVRVALDDFGTGYSSLSHLQRLPIDILKIDRSFVSGDPDHDQDWSLCGAIIKIAESLHLETIAEGIETGEQRARLTALGCDSGQGFLFQRPKPIAEVSGMLGSPDPARAPRRPVAV